jgi:hypothetical protein
MGDISLKRLPLTWTEKPSLTCHWKGYNDMSLKRLHSVCHQIIYSSQWLNMHLLSYLLQLIVSMSLYKDMPSWNASSYFTHTLLLHSRTTLFNMSDSVLPAWNRHPFCCCQHWAKMTISFQLTMYGRRCWVCPVPDPNGSVGFYISIS